MYCPLCKVVFSYSTGEIQIGGIIHQPDAVKELRKNGKLHRDVRDIPCGGVNHIFISKDKKKYPYLKFVVLKNIINTILRWCVEYEDDQMRGRNQLENVNDLNRIDRLSYLKGIITKDKFKRRIYNKYKTYEKEIEDRKLKTGFYICISDMMRSLENMSEFNNISNHIEQMFELIKNYNSEFDKINKLYKINNCNLSHLTFVKYSNINRTRDYIKFGLCNVYGYIGIGKKIDLEIKNFI